jgi:mannose-6-phosphate isomerase-like protein (cupin superfamily)
MAGNIKHGEYITELGTIQSMFKQITAPQVAIGGERDLKGAKFSMGWSYITEPFIMVAESHTHDFDQIIFFLGGDPGKVGEFDAEVEMHLGKDQKKHIINYTSCVYVPAGLFHCPLNVKKVNKPFMFIDITLSPGFSIRPLPSASQRK